MKIWIRKLKWLDNIVSLIKIYWKNIKSLNCIKKKLSLINKMIYQELQIKYGKVNKIPKIIKTKKINICLILKDLSSLKWKYCDTFKSIIYYLWYYTYQIYLFLYQ